MNKADIISKYNNLVYKLVNQYQHLADRDDLYQSGILGLLQAYEKYDASLGFNFMTYAYNFVKGEMCKVIKKNQTNLLTVDMYKLKSKLNQVNDILTSKFGRTPTVEELAAATEIDQVKIATIMGANKPLLSLDTNYNDSGTISEVIEDKTANINLDNIDLYEAIKKLSSEEQIIIYKKYFEGFTQSEIANILGVNQVSVSRKETKIMQRMRTSLCN